MNGFAEKPKLVETDLGFSVLYKDKLLYSKRDPRKSILNVIEHIEIPKETLVLCISPVLGYGLSELVQRLPEGCFAVALEADKNLAELTKARVCGNTFDLDKLIFVQSDSVPQVLKGIEAAVEEKKLRRVLKIDFSAGAAFYPEFYAQIEAFTEDYISRYWINRLTLIRFGRNYARNFFKNYSLIEKNREKYGFLKTGYVRKPVLVLGAGPSLDCAADFILKNCKNLFVLAVDAACKGLYPLVEPDAAVLLECQYWIQGAFIGLKNANIPVFADLTANSAALSSTGGRAEFFFTEYTVNGFFSGLHKKGLLPARLEPMGSVGLTALKLAEKITAKNVPIFHTGLDFSWKKGFTHSKFAFQISDAFWGCTRLSSLYNGEALFQEKLRTIKGKNGGLYTTSPVLQNYAEIYKHGFSHKSNLFDISQSGLAMNSNIKTFDEAEQIIAAYLKTEKPETRAESSEAPPKTIAPFLSAEKKKLKELKDIFTGNKPADDDLVKSLLRAAPYLYLHFPDYSEKNIMNKDFLNRIRIELEYFLKILN